MSSHENYLEYVEYQTEEIKQHSIDGFSRQTVFKLHQGVQCMYVCMYDDGSMYTCMENLCVIPLYGSLS